MKKLLKITSLVCLGFICICALGHPVSYMKVVNKGHKNFNMNIQGAKKYSFANGDLAVEITSLSRQGANVEVVAKLKNMRNNPFFLGSDKERMYLVDENDDQWFYTDDDYGFTFLRPNFEFMPGIWRKVTFKFNKPKGKIESSSFTFLLNVSVLGAYKDKIDVSIKNIPDGYGF